MKKSSNRWKNIWTYIGIIGVIGTALNVNAASLTSWGALWDSIVAFISNPYLIVTVVMALCGTYVDPTTGGLKD
jgi:phi LC3 family holin